MALFNCRVSAIATNGNKVLIIKRNANFIPTSKEHAGWEFCGGGIEHDETPEAALIREYQEETGINVRVIKLISARTGYRDDKPLLNLFYHCEYIDGDVQLTAEHSEYKWVEISELKNIQFGEHVSLDRKAFLKTIISN